ncbi:membrane-associated, eicosanoid/glutathione metabolism protein [Hypoxylon rubiginosum]|uniref:Membrane-associated, eicosanoid/glutathione metabolism protein n=1 Tax=Hypoxylon rubiginosum TaxID=110542 RepID=A0ACC0D0N4_9PEZI|nr:membrane-associated, eicosanoid/glutathione metabolism protein [Hypoxylon rubiginosum]
MSYQPGLRLPVTGAFALPFAGYFVFLSLRVSLTRIAQQVALGDTVPPPPPSFSSSAAAAKKDDSPPPPPPSSSSSPSPSASAVSSPSPYPSYGPLQLATRAHQNFAENVPLALVLAAVAELNGAEPGRLATGLAVLFGLRVLHAEFGLNRPDALGIGRPVGYYGTMAWVGWLAGWSAWLVYTG